jgi:uncharacterized coiled-coil protein SlyX
MGEGMTLEREVGHLQAAVTSLEKAVAKQETDYKESLRAMSVTVERLSHAVAELSEVVSKLKGGWIAVTVLLTFAGAVGGFISKIITIVVGTGAAP